MQKAKRLPDVAAVANPITLSRSTPETETAHQSRPQLKKDDFSEVRPFWLEGKRQDSVLPKHDNTIMQSRNMPATLQQFKTQASSVATVLREGNEGQMLEVNYHFQRWSGDHSVRILVREGNVTLHPSGARAADVLRSNMVHLASLAPELLLPQQERDEQQQQRRQQQGQDEDQE